MINICRNLYAVVIELVSLHEYPAKVVLATSETTEIKAFLASDIIHRKKGEATVYLLDIDLNQQDTGLDLAHKIRTDDPNAYIIFVTIMQKHMRDAFKYKAFDFVIKSHTESMKEDLHTVFQRLVHDYQQWNEDGHRPKRLKFTSLSRNISIAVSEFIGIKKDGKTYSTYTTQGVFRYFKTLKTVMEQLENYPNIVRCHESAIVNLDHVLNIDRDKKIIYCRNGSEFPVARRRMNEVLKRWQSEL
ncbi:response regulator transcription factor [Clostridium sp. 'deep sea']|uniref:LytR/AlgR family response regulator transcription factor n=1 Tax=Clostridium sp. 'deep sea' TaxID=2779445 RepID=UPI001896A3E8|nr:LytTR family DNA-binding domain-containing protein [Clostridium sp. 'deep sea']QOR33869.1 response regulator transcription factor [Clostridium sp. 'deep sea']